MLESPTGTGKTLSLICSAMQWVVDHREKQQLLKSMKPDAKLGEANDDGNCDEPQWMRDFDITAVEKKDVPRRRSEFGLGDFDKKRSGARSANVQKMGVQSLDDEEDFLLEEYVSEDESTEDGIEKLKRKRATDSNWSSSDEEAYEEEDEEVIPKVYFCSRTHSQLSQFVNEFRRTGFALALKVTCLGSRKNLCINSEVLKLRNPSQINERCLELQKNQKDAKLKVLDDKGKMRPTKGTSGCPMLRRQKLQKLFKNEVWNTDAMDIEDLVQLGSKIGTCPYYGARNMVPSSDIIVLPYQSLFLRSARESLGINLKKSIIIIDEAHNLADSLTNMYNAKISETQLKRILDVLEFYINKFRSCLGPGNRRYIQTLIVLIQSFLQKLLEFHGTSSSRDEQGIKGSLADTSMTINDFLFSLNIDNLNLVKLHRYIKDSKIIHKVSGYGTKLASLQSHNSICFDSQNNSDEGSILSGFQTLDNIIISLVHNDRDGRVLLSRPKLSGQKEEGYIKFMMLSGHTIFSEVLDQAYGVVLAGGTLQPIEETRVRLFPNLSRDEVHFYTCNHIVPPESILPIVVSHGPSGIDFDFSYNSRNSSNMIEELGRLLCNLVAIVPEGIVVFFSSFDYEGRVYDAWKASGVLSKISKKKIVYREPKSSNDVEHVLKKYKETIASCDTILKDTGVSGALLLAVVGGKISEGINLSDGMGRCILMVGLPYPSPDIELIERVQHIEGLGQAIPQRCNKPFRNSSNDGHKAESGFDFLRRCKQRGKEYFENLCMKAVNQSIGRAIRHVNDYAAVLLVDSRYACSQLNQNLSHPTNKLPLWIKQQLVSSTQNYGEVHRLLHKFFLFNRQKRHT
ncbi:uncharacterized protein LOC141822000 [Curcuma longa]|uniref:uncharacterized protein LOC141822000 n=1 Tax=Curcuma longa TaxID=136217 RepID=UPI003D9E52C7